MSFKLMTLIHDMVGLDVVPKAVLMAVASYAKDDGRGCFAGQRSIGQRAGCSERAVRKYLKRLEQQGLVRRKHRQRRDGSRTSDDYELSVHAIATYRHCVPDGSAAVDNPSTRHRRSSQTAQNVEPIGMDAQSNRRDVPGKNLSVESISGIYQQNLSPQGDSLPSPLQPPASPNSDKAAVADHLPRPAIKKAEVPRPETEAERSERIEAERERQLQLVHKHTTASQPMQKPEPESTVITGDFSKPRLPPRPKLNEFARSKAAYQRKAAKKVAAAAREATGTTR